MLVFFVINEGEAFGLKKSELREKEKQIIEDIKENELHLKSEIEEDVLTLRENFKENEESIRHYLREMFSIKEDAASNEEIKHRILSGGVITGTNMVVMVCAILIASVGLNTNSVAIIIGAMLISPLMGSILAIAYGTASNSKYLIEKHMAGLAVQIFISIMTATLYFLLSPVKGVTEQLLARTKPSLFDVIVAIAGGVAGIVGQTRMDKSNNIIPGVAIATALMPPLCTCGYAISRMNFQMLAGASYLFLINAYFIYASASVVLAILGTPHARAMTDKQWIANKRKMIRNTALVLMPVIIVAIYDIIVAIEG